MIIYIKRENTDMRKYLWTYNKAREYYFFVSKERDSQKLKISYVVVLKAIASTDLFAWNYIS